MLDEEIYKLRQQLDESIKMGKTYNEIYNLSIKLDELIIKHYVKDILETKK